MKRVRIERAVGSEGDVPIIRVGRGIGMEERTGRKNNLRFGYLHKPRRPGGGRKPDSPDRVAYKDRIAQELIDAAGRRGAAQEIGDREGIPRRTVEQWGVLLRKKKGIGKACGSPVTPEALERKKRVAQEAMGKSWDEVQAIARREGVTERTVNNWRKRWGKDGLEARRG